MKLISEFDILESDGLIVLELLSGHMKQFRELSHDFECVKERRYGKTTVVFLKK